MIKQAAESVRIEAVFQEHYDQKDDLHDRFVLVPAEPASTTDGRLVLVAAPHR